MKAKSPKSPWTRAEKSLLLAPLLIALASGGIWWWQKSRAVSIPAKYVETLHFSPDGRFLAVGDSLQLPNKPYTGVVTIYDAQSGAFVCDLKVPRPWSNLLEPVWANHGSIIAASVFDLTPGSLTSSVGKTNYVYKLAVWDVPSGRLRFYAPVAPANEWAWISKSHFSRDGRFLFAENDPPAVFSAQTGARLRSFTRKTTEQVENMGFFFDADSKLLLQRPQDVSIVKVSDGKTLQSLPIHTKGRLNGLSADGQFATFVTSHWNTRIGFVDKWTLQLWNLKTQRTVSVPALYSSDDQVFAPHDDRLAIVNHNPQPPTDRPTREIGGQLLVYDCAKSRVVWKIPMPTDFSVLRWSPDGRFLAMRELQLHEDNVRVFDARSGALKWSKIAYASNVHLEWAPDSHHLALSSSDAVQIFDIN